MRIDWTSYLAQTTDEPSGLFAWLLDLDRVNPGAGVHFGWEHPLPGWVWLLLILGVGAMACLSYRQLSGKRAGRLVLSGVRACFILFIVLIICGPMLVLPQTQIEKDHVLMLVDRSRSMEVADVDEGGVVRATREAQLKSIIAGNQDVFNALSEEHVLNPFGFSDGLGALPAIGELSEIEGQSTAMRTAIFDALRKVSGKPVSAVVLFSDGRSSETIGSETYERLGRSRIPVFVVPLGSADPPANLTLVAQAPDKVFINDSVPVRTVVSATGADGKLLTGEAKPGTKVRLIDKQTGETLDEKPIKNYNDPVQLITTPTVKQQTTWKIELVGPEQELIVSDNVIEHDISIEDKPIRVLYIDGYPRWAYRYLKNMLVREKSIESSIMLMSADRTFAQEGDIPLKRLPKDMEELKPYDVIIIGDVPGDFFGAERLKLFHDHVAKRGAGLLWLAGPEHLPESYAAGPLADLLPMQSVQAVSRMPGQVNVFPTGVAKGLGVLRLRSPFKPNDDSDWPEGLLPLYWAQSLGHLKIACEVLAEDSTTEAPIVVRMRYGSGQSLYVGTDEIWRWRYARGELYPQQFYMQLVRLLARNRLQQGGEVDDRLQFRLSTRKAAVGDTVVLELRVEDQQLLSQLPKSVAVQVVRSGEGGREETLQTLTLSGTSEPGLYRALWTPTHSGELKLKVVETGFAEFNVMREIVVSRVDDEMRFPATDHEVLKQLAEKTQGKVLAGNELTELTRLIENRQRTRAMDISEPIWNTPLALLLGLLLVTFEWVGRKIVGLV